MIREIDGIDLDERRPGWRDRYTAFYGDGMAAGTAAVLFAEDDGAFAGMACVYVLRNHRSEIFSEPSAIVSNVYVPPERRRQSVGTALMRAAVDWAREHAASSFGCARRKAGSRSTRRSALAAPPNSNSGWRKFLEARAAGISGQTTPSASADRSRQATRGARTRTTGPCMAFTLCAARSQESRSNMPGTSHRLRSAARY